MTKPVQLRSGQKFDKAKEANGYFRLVLNGGELRSYLTGDEHKAVDALFRDYCSATNWPMPGEPVHYFRDWNQAERGTTRSLCVEYANGETDDFSYLKAVRAVANWER